VKKHKFKTGDLAIFYTYEFVLDTWHKRTTAELLIEGKVIPKIGQIVKLKEAEGSYGKPDNIFCVNCQDGFDWDYSEKCFKPLTDREKFLYYTQGIENVNDM